MWVTFFVVYEENHTNINEVRGLCNNITPGLNLMFVGPCIIVIVEE